MKDRADLFPRTRGIGSWLIAVPVPSCQTCNRMLRFESGAPDVFAHFCLRMRRNITGMVLAVVGSMDNTIKQRPPAPRIVPATDTRYTELLAKFGGRKVA